MTDDDEPAPPPGRVPGPLVVYLMIAAVSGFVVFLAWLTWDVVMLRVQDLVAWLSS